MQYYLFVFCILTTLVVGQDCNQRFWFGTWAGEYSSVTPGSYDQLIVSESDGVIASVQLGDTLFGSPEGNATCNTPAPGGVMTLLQIQSSTLYSDGAPDRLGGCLTYFSALISNGTCTSGNIIDSGAMLTMQNSTEAYSVALTGVFSNATCIYALEFCVIDLLHLKLGSAVNEVAHTNRGKSMLGPGAMVNVSSFVREHHSLVWGMEVSYSDANKTVYGDMGGQGAQYTNFLVKDPSAFYISDIQIVCSYDTGLPFTQIAYMLGLFGDVNDVTSIGVWNIGAATLSTINVPLALVGVYTVNGDWVDSLEFSNAV